MGRLDWCQNKSWDADIEAAFFDKLGRAKNKSWYLGIQTSALVSSHPEVALRLLDRYFALGADADEAEEHFNRGRAHVAHRDVDESGSGRGERVVSSSAGRRKRRWPAIRELMRH